MIFFETSVFTQRVINILSDDEYRKLQAVLADRPDAGKIIPDSGGIRKIRWRASGHGKRSGARIIYYWYTKQETILMLYIYTKNERLDLTPKQRKILKNIVETEYP